MQYLEIQPTICITLSRKTGFGNPISIIDQTGQRIEMFFIFILLHPLIVMTEHYSSKEKVGHIDKVWQGRPRNMLILRVQPTFVTIVNSGSLQKNCTYFQKAQFQTS